MSKRGDTGSRKRSGAASQAAKTLGHYGGLKGGPARMASTTAAERSEIARKGGKASYKNK